MNLKNFMKIYDFVISRPEMIFKSLAMLEFIPIAFGSWQLPLPQHPTLLPNFHLLIGSLFCWLARVRQSSAYDTSLSP